MVPEEFRRYSILIIYPMTLSSENIEQSLNRTREELEKLGGKILKIEHLGKKEFCQRLKKQKEGIYERIRFEISPSKVLQFKERLRLDDRIFRYQLTKYEDKVNVSSNGK